MKNLILFFVFSLFVAASFAQSKDGKRYVISISKPAFHKQIYYLNGMWCPEEKAIAQAQKVANTLQQDLSLIYSESELEGKKTPKKAKKADILRAFLWGCGFPPKATDSLTNALYNTLQNNDTALIYAHSRGAFITYYAINRVAKKLGKTHQKALLSNIYVVTIGGYAPRIHRWNRKIHLVMIVNEYDLVPFLAGNGAKGSHVKNVSTKVHSLNSYLPYLLQLAEISKIKLFSRKKYSHLSDF